MYRVSRRSALQTIGTAGVATAAGCIGGNVADEDNEFVQAAWVFNSEIGDLGWSWAHNEGLRSVANSLEWVRVDSTVDIAPADAEPEFRQYASDGYDIIFGCTFDYQDPMTTVAEDFSETYFEHCSGYTTRRNMGRYMGRMYEPRYLSGQAAGLLTDADKLGYVAAKPLPEVIRGINAYALGVESVNESATIHVRYTDSWYDTETEYNKAMELINTGVDVMAQHQDSPAAVNAANDENIWAIGYNSPMAVQGGVNYITSPIWDWSEFYIPTIKSVRNDDWEADFYWEGLESGVCGLDEWGPQVPATVKETVDETKRTLLAGEGSVWDNSQFETLTDTFLFEQMESVVGNVEIKGDDG